MTDDSHGHGHSGRTQEAFHWIQAQRAQHPARPITELIEQARVAHALTPEQVGWLRWTLDPASVAVQPKEPT